MVWDFVHEGCCRSETCRKPDNKARPPSAHSQMARVSTISQPCKNCRSTLDWFHDIFQWKRHCSVMSQKFSIRRQSVFPSRLRRVRVKRNFSSQSLTFNRSKEKSRNKRQSTVLPGCKQVPIEYKHKHEKYQVGCCWGRWCR